MDHSKLYDLLRSKDFNSSKIIDTLEKNLEAVAKIAKQTTKEEFIGALNGDSPAIKLTSSQMELIKGGGKLAALIEQFLEWWYTSEK